MSTVITSIDPRSPAELAGVRVGETLRAINGHTVVDVLDYRFYQNESRLILQYINKKGKVKSKKVKKPLKYKEKSYFLVFLLRYHLQSCLR